MFTNNTKKKSVVLFDSKGDFIQTEYNCFVIDAILCTLACFKNIDDLHFLHFQLFLCGIYIQYPELKKAIAYLKALDVVKDVFNEKLN